MHKNEGRILRHARMMLDRNATVRQIAKITGFSKSTVHLDITVRLKEINLPLYEAVSEKLKYHFSIKHIRGGESTKIKYSKKKNNN